MSVETKKEFVSNVKIFPTKISKHLSDLIEWQEMEIKKYETDIKKMNWFSAGLLTGILATVFIVGAVDYIKNF